MYNISNLDVAIALGGYSAGVVVGCLNNVWKTGSLFKKHHAPKNVSFLVKHLEVNRDNSMFHRNIGISGFLKPAIWNPFMPLEHLGPLIIITKIFITTIYPGATVKTTNTLIDSYAFKIIVLPIVLNAAVLIGGLFLRFQSEPYVNRIGVDPSGHALIQSAAAIYKLFVFSSLSSLNLSSNVYRTIATVTTLSDYLWTYQTASNYHSVMDMAIATIFMGISFGTVYAGHRAFITYAPDMLRLLIAKIPIK